MSSGLVVNIGTGLEITPNGVFLYSRAIGERQTADATLSRIVALSLFTRSGLAVDFSITANAYANDSRSRLAAFWSFGDVSILVAVLFGVVCRASGFVINDTENDGLTNRLDVGVCE